MVGIVWRTRRRGILVWVLALAASMVGTAAAVAGLYDTPAKIHTYAEAVTSGSALAAINGHVEGIDTLGGVIQDEFGFLASFLLPLLGIALIAGSTRREEESGRLEMILGGRIARHQPALAALVVATAAILATSVVFAAGLVALGGPGVRGGALQRGARRAGLRVRRIRCCAGTTRAARAWRLHVEPDRAGGRVRPARGRRYDHQLVGLAVAAGVGGEDRTVRRPSGGGCSPIPVVAGLASGAAAVCWPVTATSAAPWCAAAPGAARAAGFGGGRSASRPGSTVRRPRAGWRARSCSPR